MDIKKYLTLDYFKKTAESLKEFCVTDPDEILKRYLALVNSKLEKTSTKTVGREEFETWLIGYIKKYIVEDSISMCEHKESPSMGFLYKDKESLPYQDYADDIAEMVEKHTSSWIPLMGESTTDRRSSAEPVRVPIFFKRIYKKVGE